MGINSVDGDTSGASGLSGGLSYQAGAEALAALSLRCVECGATYGGFEPKARYRCDCGGVLDIETTFQLPHAKRASTLAPLARRESDVMPLAGAPWRQLFDERASAAPIWPLSPDTLLPDRSGVWRYRELILPVPTEAIVSRPEGNTGLYPVGLENCSASRIGHRQIGTFTGLERLFLKHEGENPTGSFKDRGMTAGVTVARLRGARAVACASTGNTSASLASYAAQAGMQGIVFLPAGQISGGKLAQSLAYGATTVQIAGDFDTAMQLVEQVCNELGVYLLNSLNPFRVEGQKAIGLEILQQLDWQAPDWLVLPAGNLGNTSAIGKAFRQAYQLGLIQHLPRIASIQASGANPFYRSYQQGWAHRERVHAQTVASAIKIGDPVSYERARRIIEESHGLVAEVTDEEILAAKAIIDRSGIGCEPASAASIAGAKKLVADGTIKRDERVVAILTGHMLKDSTTGIPQGVSGQAIEPTFDAVRKALKL
jgi:threonine synthase